MNDDIIRPQDMDQVLFMGENNLYLMEFRLMHPSSNPGFSTIIFGEPYFFGMFKREKVAVSIENSRILKQTMLINGKRTLIVMADLDSVDKNRSMMDMATTDLQRKIRRMDEENKQLESEITLRKKFMDQHNMEDTWEEWLMNKMELFRVAQQKTQKPESGTPVSVEASFGEQKKGK